MKIKLLILTCFIIFGIQLYHLNYEMHDYYKMLYKEKTERYVYGASARRGRILDRNGNVLVDNKTIYNVSYHEPLNITVNEKVTIASLLTPYLSDVTVSTKDKKNYYLATHNNGNDLITKEEWEEYEKRNLTIENISQKKWDRITNEDIEYPKEEEKIIYLFSKMNDGYIFEDKILLNDISDEAKTEIESMHLSPIQITTSWKRTYNYEDTLRSILGGVGPIPKENLDYYLKSGYKMNDIIGISGLESYYEDTLKGEKALYMINSDNSLTLLEEEKQGDDITLNIDINIQLELDKILKEEIILSKNRRSSKYFRDSFGIIGDPSNGAILAISGIRLMDNGTTSDISILSLTNSYTMGSVVKGASHTVGYLTNSIEVGKKIKDSCVKLWSEPSKCSYKYLGYIDDITSLKTSSNYYQFLTAIKSTGNNYKYNMHFDVTEENFNTYRNIFAGYGLGVKTGIDYPNEQTGMKGTKIAGDLLLNFAIGQYDTYTPISLLQYINTIANHGIRYALRLKKEDYNNFLDRINMDDAYYERIIEGMYLVLHGGTATYYMNRNLEGVGKTGTSEAFYDSDSDGQVDTEVINSTFASFFPRESPKYSFVIIAPAITNSSTTSYPFTQNTSKKISSFLSNY